MNPPRTTAGTVGAALGILAAGGAASALLVGVVTKGRGDPLGGAILTVEAGVFGVLAAGFGGLVLAAANPKWKGVGETAALVGIGAPVVLGAIGLTKATVAMAEQSQLPAQTAQTYTITATNTGQSLNVNVGDTINVLLDSTYAAPTVSATGVLSAGTSGPTTQAQTPASGSGSSAATTTYPFTAVAAGTVDIEATSTSGQNAGQQQPGTGTTQTGEAFSLSVTAS